MNDREYLMFYSALQWAESNEIERDLSEGVIMPQVVSKMHVGDSEKQSRAQSLVVAMRMQASRWDGLVHSR